MAILRVKQTWKKQREPKARAGTERVDSLSPEERANVIAALKVLRVRFGTWQAVADALKVTHKSVENAVSSKQKPSAGLAIRTARAAGVPVDDVLSGAFPKPGACPMCGRS